MFHELVHEELDDSDEILEILKSDTGGADSEAEDEIVNFSDSEGEADECKLKIDMLAKTTEGDQLITRIWDKMDESSKEKRYRTVLSKFSRNSEDPSEECTIVNYTKYKTPTFCICSQHITKVYFIRNLHNNNVLRVGSECINKTMGEQARKDAKALVKQDGYQGQKRMCVGCLKYNISSSEDPWKNKCLSCYRHDPTRKAGIFRKGRECCDCHRLTIAPNEPKWKVRCLPCYILDRNKKR